MNRLDNIILKVTHNYLHIKSDYLENIYLFNDNIIYLAIEDIIYSDDWEISQETLLAQCLEHYFYETYNIIENDDYSDISVTINKDIITVEITPNLKNIIEQDPILPQLNKSYIIDPIL